MYLCITVYTLTAAAINNCKLCYNLLKNSLAVKKVWPCLKWPVLKSCEIEGSDQEMAVMVQVDGKILIATI